MCRSLLLTLACVSGALLLPGAAVAAPANGTFAGSLGAPVPKGAQGSVRAIDRATGALVAAKPVARSGKFSLSLPGGSYVLVGTVVPVKRGAKITQTRIGVSLRPGQRRRNASLKARKRKKKAARGHAAYVQEHGEVTPGRVAVQIYDVTGNVTGDFKVVLPGLNDLLLDDVLNGAAGQECGVTVLEVDRLADVLKELEFEQSPYVDPATRVERNFALGDVEVRGTLSPVAGSPDATDLSLKLLDKTTGAVLDQVAGRLDRATFFDDLSTVGRKLGDALCKLSDVYEVTLDVNGRGDFATHNGSGTLHAVLRARRPDAKAKRWTGEGALQWGDLAVATKIPECPLVSPVAPAITWTATIALTPTGELEVTWGPSGNEMATATVDCVPSGPGEPDPPPIPGMPIVSLLNTGPLTFTVPPEGGTQALSGEVVSDGDGFRDSGTITVKPAGVAGSRP